jgi:hypothetical protein
LVKPNSHRACTIKYGSRNFTHINTARHVSEESVFTFCTFNAVKQALKKQIITVFETMYLEILNDDMVGFANHLFMTYGNITAVYMENNFEQMHCSWDPQQPVESLFKKIQDCADYSEAGGFIIGHPHQINVGYTKIFATGNFMRACRRWNEKPKIEKNLVTIQGTFRRCTAAAQANAS